MLKRHPLFLSRLRDGRCRVRDRPNRKHCPSHDIWSYKRDGRSSGVLLYEHRHRGILQSFPLVFKYAYDRLRLLVGNK